MHVKMQRRVLYLARDVVADIDLLVVEKHAIDGLDGAVGCLSCLVVHETVTLGATVFISGHFA